ncbi:MAG TPA: orotidine-5'-phosphate decarboxylase [Candidatus Thiothrix moscowensis]|uniref:orotidine-5'-phosphate decarboxylase n=1 Tax=unclassified Thiothrix TaxID=2636184 RepID=UPI0025E04EE6|nr:MULTISPECIES: orotidine-5'-phosphate decarboxylase [unclassified Thiothrix]HRJ53559.1 orotidine-5'-phosphate decarboxylase [Candidatus Thiothrix moscowensis]HRJ93633.1 orotidine-5'-phosphate decarboxylase [Candidatus Thiothrix moscowensis]
MSSRLIIALDFATAEHALAFVEPLDPAQCKLKVGFELFVAAGPDFVRQLSGRGFDVFLDLKFHDIPNTVASACKAAANLGVWMINVHASGGSKMMEAARAALQDFAQPPRLIAVTVLTSMDKQQLQGTGIALDPAAQVQHLAQLTAASGLDGVVCSAQEAALLRKALGDDFLLVTPGIRPAGSEQGDQSRVMTPAQARAAGVSYAVVGRPITQAADPLAVIAQINADLGA